MIHVYKALFLHFCYWNWKITKANNLTMLIENYGGCFFVNSFTPVKWMEVNTLYNRQHHSHLGTSKTVDLLEMVFIQNIPSLTDCMICHTVLYSGENRSLGTTGLSYFLVPPLKCLHWCLIPEKYGSLGFKFRKLESLLIGFFWVCGGFVFYF